MELVPEIDSCHHERVNGTGYCKGLKGEELLVQSKILALIDVFEALTALDRPYKPPIPIEKALQIINQEVELGHIDQDLFQVFMNEKIYNIYRGDLDANPLGRPVSVASLRHPCRLRLIIP